MGGEAVPALTHASCIKLNSVTGTFFSFVAVDFCLNHSISASKGIRHLGNDLLHTQRVVQKVS